MNNSYRDRTLALAGVFQAARLVQQLAHEGRSDSAALAASINSVLELESATTDDIYGGACGVLLGLQLVRDKLSGRTDHSDVEMARYVVNVLRLERRLERNTAMLETIRRGIEAIVAQTVQQTDEAGDDEEVHLSLTAKLAELYRMTLSTLTPRIMISGERGYLANPAIADKVRAVLLAGIRSAFLWRQLGGSRWQLLFRKAAIVREAIGILEQLRTRDATA
ncbi:MAG: high frequency lysogenization protein HflD [Acidiferrobacterales bacterium]